MDSSGMLKSYIEKKGLKKTAERSVVLDVIKKIQGHFDAEGLLSQANKRNSKISRASAYRTINLFVEAGIIKESLLRGGRKVYEYGPEKTHHDHMICEKCGRLIEFSDTMIEKHQRSICKRHKFQMTGHKLEIKGICSSCR
jgi:Fur family ferric uptake transcriptional regulator